MRDTSVNREPTRTSQAKAGTSKKFSTQQAEKTSNMGEQEDDICVSVFGEVDEEGFDGPMVDLLLQEAMEGQIDLMGDVLIHLCSKQHADWAAELCR